MLPEAIYGFNAILIGVGNLGRALIENFSFAECGFTLSAAFDINPALIGTNVNGVNIYSMDELEAYLHENKVDMVTFDGASGGSGYSPCAMMNEWCQPTVTMEAQVVSILEKLKDQYDYLPAINITGGFAGEADVFKALALGDGKVTTVGLCRAAMAAAMNAAAVGKLIESGNVPAHLQKYGTTVQEIFADLPDLRALYGTQADSFSPGARGSLSCTSTRP